MELLHQIECWCIFELTLPPMENKHGAELDRKVVFTKDSQVREVAAFSDSEGTYRVRFMPDEQGIWLYEIRDGSSAMENGMSSGRVLCTAPQKGNYGPVGVISDKDFCYADGTPYYPFGTTCLYGLRWDQWEITLTSITAASFNKVRFELDSSFSEFTRLEKAIVQLQELGVEVYLLLDCGAGGPQAAAFLQYTITRLSAYRNIWWSLRIDGEQAAVEYNKKELLRLIENCDPYHHLLTVHSSNPWSDYGISGMTHVSLQGMDPSQVSYYSRLHGKPILMDECGCEGDAPTLWGSLPGEEMVHRIWESLCRGGYAGHGEMFLQPDWLSWHQAGGTLQGAAVSRIAFLRSILEEAPLGLRYMPIFYDAATIGCEGEYYLQYFGIHRFPSRELNLPQGRYTVEIIDVWNMTISAVPDIYDENRTIKLPTLPYHALRIRSLDSSEQGTQQQQQKQRKYDRSLKGAGIGASADGFSNPKDLNSVNSVIQHAEQNDNYTLNNSQE